MFNLLCQITTAKYIICHGEKHIDLWLNLMLTYAVHTFKWGVYCIKTDTRLNNSVNVYSEMLWKFKFILYNPIFRNGVSSQI